MNIDQFNKLQQEHGKNVVWQDNDGFNFCIGGGDDDDIDVSSESEHDRLETECENVDEVEFCIGYGDDTVNCVSVKSLDDFIKVPGLEEFTLQFVGHNCYTDE